MQDGHPVAPSNGHQQMVRPHAPLSDEEPRAEADLRSVVGDEEEHHEKKPMMTKMKDKMRKIKNNMTKKKHGHVDDHDVQDDDEHSVEAEGEGEGYDDADEEMEMEMEPEIHRAPRHESTATSDGLGGGDKPFTTGSRDEHIDLGTQDRLGGIDDPLPLSSRGEHVPLSSREDSPVTLASRDQHVPTGGLGSRDERHLSLGDREKSASLGGLQEPPVTPETINADPVDPFPNGSVSRADDGNGNEQSMSPDVLSSFRDMDISSDVEKKPSYTEKLSSTAVAAKNAAVSAASTVYAKVAGGTHSGETHDQIATPVGSRSGVEVEPKEGAGEKKGSYTEKLSSTAVAAKDAAVSAASTVYAKVAGGTHSGEKHDEIATRPGVVVEPREGAGEKKGTYTEKLTGTALAAKDAAMNAASTVYGKVTGKVQPGGGTEQEKGVSVKEYLAEKLRPGEDDKALCEVISESMKKKGVEEHEVVEDKEGEVKGRIVLPAVTAGEIGVTRDLGKVGGGDGGEGMMEKVNGVVSSMVGRGGGSGGDAANEIAHA